MDLKLGIVCKL